MKRTILAASLLLGCMSISVFGSNLLASERKIGVVYSLTDDPYKGRIREIKQSEKDTIVRVINELKERIAGEPEYSPMSFPLKLVIQTEFPWVYSDVPDYHLNPAMNISGSAACIFLLTSWIISGILIQIS